MSKKKKVKRYGQSLTFVLYSFSSQLSKLRMQVSISWCSMLVSMTSRVVRWRLPGGFSKLRSQGVSSRFTSVPLRLVCKSSAFTVGHQLVSLYSPLIRPHRNVSHDVIVGRGRQLRELPARELGIATIGQLGRIARCTPPGGSFRSSA